MAHARLPGYGADSRLNLDHVELNRTFRVLPPAETDTPAEDLTPGFGAPLSWTDLLAERRVVLLSEAGSGKTEEIRHTARRLRAEGLAAFFLRLEYLVDGFDTAFEEGSDEEFEAWLSSSEEGWLFLDSVDEARLKSPRDFEAAIRRVAVRLKAARSRTRILITGRTTAWRPISDLQMCARQLNVAAGTAHLVPGEGGGERVERRGDDDRLEGFRVVTLANLTPEQIERFAVARNVTDPAGLLEAIERADAWSFAARPQDLSEIIGFWNDNRRIGTRLELMRASIDRRLLERDPNRSEARPLARTRATEAARLLAGAATLTGRQTIDVPDAVGGLGAGLKVMDVLPEWDEVDLSILLARPVFDDEIYGAVRFHHRPVREYLMAEWVNGLLQRQTSRRRVEQIFFRDQYGIEVVVPTFRPVLPWLILLDEGVRKRVARLAPEIFFEGGDPSQLPLETRRAVLKDVCDRIASGHDRYGVGDYDAIRRFALPDLGADVAALIDAYRDNDDVLWTLMRMIWQGELRDARPQALRVALDPAAGKYVRIAAFRAVRAVGEPEDMVKVRAAFAEEPGPLRRDWLAELLPDAPKARASVDWLVACLARIAPLKPHGIDQIGPAITLFAHGADSEVLVHLLRQTRPLLSEPPLIERRLCEVSERFVWLLNPLAIVTAALIEARHPAALEAEALNVLQQLPNARNYDRLDGPDAKVDLPGLVADWHDLRVALFWHVVGGARLDYDSRKGERLTDAWPALVFTPLLRFGDTDFDRILDEVGRRDGLDDRMVALSLAFRLYVGAGRPRRWRDRLKRVAGGEEALVAQLHGLLNPPPLSDRDRRMNRTSGQWEKRNAEREARQTKNRQQWRDHLAGGIEGLRSPAHAPGVVTQGQLYLFEAVRAAENGTANYSLSDWRMLEAEFGESVARAFRDGLVGGWRRYAPPTRSQGAEPNSIPYVASLGLMGITIESVEVDNWTTGLTEADVETAFRHAMFELNGMPPWLPQLFEAFPDLITRLALTEIEFELDNDAPDRESHYLLYDVNWSGQWFWEALARPLIQRLAVQEPRNLRNLRYVLNILLGSTLPDGALADIARGRAQRGSDERAALWFAAWVTVDPDAAVPELAGHIAGLAEAERLPFTMTFLNHLIGGRRTEGFWRRDRFRTAAHLKALYLIAHTHVRESEDIHRAGTGVYSPGVRDDAQDARDTLFRWLQEIPGKETFLALREIAETHPTATSRPWFDRHAQRKAEADVVGAPWAAVQVREFHDALERTPATHRELHDLAVLRLLDLKADLEHGDSSEAAVLRKEASEVNVRKLLGNRLRAAAAGRYVVPQEEELADAKRPDFRVHGTGFDAPVPVELKLADNWSGPDLPERLEVQLCGDYLRDDRSSLGVFVLVYRGEKTFWELEPGKRVDFDGLVAALEAHWVRISPNHPQADGVAVIGIDLTRRDR